MVKVSSQPGPTSLGRYQLLFMLGQGGMGEVHLAKLTGAAGFEKLCIVKTILPQMQADPQFVERFHHEARVLVQLNHSNIAQVYDMGEVDRTLYMAIEYVPGVDLSRVESRVRQQSALMPVPIALFLAQRITEALGYAHRKAGPDGAPLGIVHRDVSPQNVMVSYEGEVKVIDFGLAKSAGRSQHTLPQTVMGKLGYMSPEQAMAKPVDHRSDIYSAGIIAWEMLAGRPLYQGGTMAEMVAQMAFPKVPPIGSVRTEISLALEQIVMRALQPEPPARYARADEFARALNELAVREGLTVGAEEVGNYIRAMCPEEFAAERQLQSRLSLLRRKAAAADTEPEATPLGAIEGTLLKPGSRAATPGGLTAAQRALSLQVDPALARVPTVISSPGQGAATASPRPRTPAPVTPAEESGPVVLPRSRTPLVVAVVALGALAVGAAVVLMKGPEPAPAPPVARAEPEPARPAPEPAAPEKPSEKPSPQAPVILGEVEPAGPLVPVQADGEEAFVVLAPGQKAPFKEAEALLVVGEVPAGTKKAPLYAHATVVDVKPTLVKIFKADGALPAGVKLFAARDPVGRAPAAHREPAGRPPAAHPAEVPPRVEPPPRVEVARAEPPRPEPVKPPPPVKPEPARVEPGMTPVPFPTGSSATPAPAPGPRRQLLGTVTIAPTVVQIVNTGAFDYTECTVRLVNNRSAKVPQVAKGSWVGLRPHEFKADPRPPDPQFAGGWSAVYCAEGTGYFHTTTSAGN